MAVQGVFASDSGITGNRKGDFATALLRTMPNGSAPLFALSSGMESADAGDTVITWFEENHNPGRVSITNNAGTGTALTVSTTDATNVVANGIYLVESTGEYVYVTAVAGTALTVVRGFAGTTITSVDGSGTAKGLQRIGSANEEGSSRPTSIANLGFPLLNYMQIFRNGWDVTGTARAIEWYTGDVVAKNRRDAGNFHAEEIEKSLFFGKKTLGVKNSKPFRTMDGILAFFSTNVTTQATSTKYTDIRVFLQGLFQWNIQGKPNERIAFCGNSVLAVLDTLAMTWGKMYLEPGNTEFGMAITRWVTPFGTISLLTHPLLVENPVWTKNMYVLHPGAMRTRWLRRTHEDTYDAEGRRAGVDADYGVLTSELSIEYKAERTGGIFTGIDTANVATL